VGGVVNVYRSHSFAFNPLEPLAPLAHEFVRWFFSYSNLGEETIVDT